MTELRDAMKHAGSVAGSCMEKKLLHAFKVTKRHYEECVAWMEKMEHEENWDDMIERHAAEAKGIE